MRDRWQRRPGDRIIRRLPFGGFRLRRVLTVPGLYSIGYGNVGSSIYYALGLTAMAAMGATPIALGVAGIFFMFTALSYAEGSAALPEAGGSASFARHAFNDLISFISGWSLMLGYIVTIAISAFTIPPYLGYFWGPLKESQVLGTAVSMGFIMLIMFLNILGIRAAAQINVGATILDLTTQILLVVLGMVLLFTPEKLSHSMFDFWPGTSDLAYGIAIAMVAYIGLESVAQVSGEARRPQQRLPRAMMLVVATVIIVFGGISITALSAMTPRELATTWAANPVAGIAQSMPYSWLRQALAPLVAFLAANILFMAANSGLMGASRLAFFMSSHRQMPAILSKVHPTFRTPFVSIIVFSLVGLLILSPGLLGWGVFRNMGALYAFGAMLAFALAHLSILALRVKEPDLPRPFKLRVSIPVKGRRLPVTALLGLAFTLGVWLVMVITNPYSRWVGLGWMVFGLLGYVLYRRSKGLPLGRLAEPEPPIASPPNQ